MTAYYNEHDPYAVEWLRRLILNGHIAPGDVDESDIRDIRPDDLKGYTQCHFFAGIGVWSHALRRAGWPDDRPIWTGSCPCQPFSAAGARAGFADERHLWPAFNHLIDQCRPPVVAGEQVENAGEWLDLVSADLEAQGYAFGAAFLPAAGFGGAHIRSRNYWLAHLPNGDGRRGERGTETGIGSDGKRRRGFAGGGVDVRLADSTNRGRGIVGSALEQRDVRHVDGGSGAACGVANNNNTGLERRARMPERANQCAVGSGSLVSGVADHYSDRRDQAGRDSASAGHDGLERDGSACALDDGTWPCAPMLGRDPVDWLFCRDGKWRPVEPGFFEVAYEIAARMGRLCPSTTQEAERLIHEAARRFSTTSDDILRAMRPGTDAAHIQERQDRRAILACEATVLLTSLREHYGQVRSKPDADHGASEGRRVIESLRVLWRNGEVGDPPHQRGLEGQPARELADAMRVLSSSMARFAQAAGYPVPYANAPASFPLECGGQGPSQNRAGRLRAYGNALDAETATQFLEAVRASL